MGKYFTVDELCKSSVAKQKGINNTPSESVKKNIENLIEVLDVIRGEWGSPLLVNSGYRCPALNTAVKGSKTSDHLCNGDTAAADITAKNLSDNKRLYDLIIKLHKDKKIKFKQLINEKPKNGIPSWIHIGISPSDNKGQIFTIN